MALSKKAATGQPQANDWFGRVTRGTTFFALEHSMNMLFTVGLTGLIVGGALVLIGLWAGGYSQVDVIAPFFLSSMGLWVAAALLSVSPLVWLLDARTRAESVKRTGFTGRLAYKVPLYIALGVVALIKLCSWVTILTVVLFSLAAMDRAPLALAELWAGQFTPALIALIVFGATGWFLMRRAKGVDDGRTLTKILVSIGVLLGVILFVSAAITLQSADKVQISVPPTLDNAWRNYMESPQVESTHDHFDH